MCRIKFHYFNLKVLNIIDINSSMESENQGKTITAKIKSCVILSWIR